jgi:exodeoxyribonuclease-1
VAPIGVLAAEDGWGKIKLDMATIEKHRKILLSAPHFAENIHAAYQARPSFAASKDPEAQLYGGFLSDRDKLRVETVRNASERELADFHPEFRDERLAPLLLHYKARNFAKTLSQAELGEWEAWRTQRISQQLPGFMKSINQLAGSDDSDKQFLLQELQLWLESIAPSDASE